MEVDRSMTSEKLKDKYPIIASVKRKMKQNNEISVNQVWKHDRRVENSAFIMTYLQMLQNENDQKKDLKKQLKEEKKEHEHSEMCCKEWMRRYNELSIKYNELSIEKFGELSSGHY